MATSGSTDWTLNRDQVITGALRKLAVLPSGGTASPAQISDAAVALNGIVKTLQADGMPLWKITSTSFTTVAGTDTYNIGPAQTVATTGKPLRVHQAFYTLSGGNNTPMNVMNRYDFKDLPEISAEGTPVNLYYQPLNTYGVIKIWPAPIDSTTTITVHYQTPFEDMDAAGNDFDFPSEWIQPLIYLLAWSLAPEFGIPPTDRGLLANDAKYWKDYALSMGGEEGSLFLMPEWSGGYR
jgi:hypothetical protein